MYMSQTIRDKFAAAMKVALDCIPDGTYFDFDGSYLNLQARTLDRVRETRRLFPPAVWQKTYREATQWWEYIATFGPVAVRIYACKDNPPTCRLIEEEYEGEVLVPTSFEKKEIEVPTGYEKKKVMLKRTRVQCDEPELASA